MKRFTKICLWIAAICTALGILLVGVGFVAGGAEEWDYVKDKVESKIETRHQISISLDNLTSGSKNENTGSNSYSEQFERSKVTGIDLDVDYGEITIRESDTDEYRVEMKCDHNGYAFSCELSPNGTLTITGEDGGMVHNDANVKISIDVPKDVELETLYVELDAGVLKIDELRSAFAEIDLDAGKIEGTMFLGELILDCDAGSVEMDGRIDGDADINCDVGNVKMTLEGNSDDHNYNVDCGVGKVTIGDYEANGVSNYTINHNAGSTYKISCDVGKIELQFKHTNE